MRMNEFYLGMRVWDTWRPNVRGTVRKILKTRVYVEFDSGPYWALRYDSAHARQFLRKVDDSGNPALKNTKGEAMPKPMKRYTKQQLQRMASIDAIQDPDTKGYYRIFAVHSPERSTYVCVDPKTRYVIAEGETPRKCRQNARAAVHSRLADAAAKLVGRSVIFKVSYHGPWQLGVVDSVAVEFSPGYRSVFSRHFTIAVRGKREKVEQPRDILCGTRDEFRALMEAQRDAATTQKVATAAEERAQKIRDKLEVLR